MNDIGDIANKQIEINSEEPKNSVSISNKGQVSQKKISPSSLAGGATNKIKGVFNNFKGLIKLGSTSPETSQINENQDNPESLQVQISSSNNQAIQQIKGPQTKFEQCKEKISNTIISTIEVQRNYTVFFTLLGLGCFLLCMSVFMLPFIITSPSKFSMCFAFGSVLVLVSFLFFHGTKAYVEKLFDKNRFWISALFILSIILGIIFSFAGKYILSLPCSLFQLFALVMFILTFIPGGRKGIEAIKRKLSSPFARVFMGMAASELGQQ